jgi:hypothetical protein
MAFNPSDEQRGEIQEMARLCVSEKAIAKQIGAQLPDLNAECGKAIAAVRLQTNMEVLSVLHEMATNRRNLSATLFWVKTHCMDLFEQDNPETPVSPKSSKDINSIPKHLRRLEFTVYNNDGEPNADY